MPLKPPIHPGRVAWTGENPGILLKKDPDGPWSSIALFFRVFWSPKGRGTALLLFEKPDVAESLPSVHNIMLSDNQPMAEFLLDTFISKLAVFAESPAFSAIQHVSITESYAAGDPRSRYSEIVNADNINIELHWDGLGKPVALELPAELTGGKEHEAYNVLVESRQPEIKLNGKSLPGKPVPRVQAGIETTSAFLYFSETWIDPDGVEPR